METLVKIAEIIIAFCLTTFLGWYVLESFKFNKKFTAKFEEFKDAFGRQETTIEQIKFENRKTTSEIHSFGETLKDHSGRVQRELDTGNIRLGEVERETRRTTRTHEHIHRRINIQDDKLRNHSRIIKKLTMEGKYDNDDEPGA